MKVRSQRREEHCERARESLKNSKFIQSKVRVGLTFFNMSSIILIKGLTLMLLIIVMLKKLGF